MSAVEPLCSLIVPTYRRPAALADCLAALAALDYPRNRLEVIVVDDGGGVPLEPVVEPARDRLDVRLLSQRRSGPAAARNRGADTARGELLAFTDDDCRPMPGWLRRLAAEHRQTPGAMLGGHTRNALVRNPFATTSQLIIDAGYAWHNRDPAAARFLTSNNMAIPAAGFRALGGFDEGFVTSEDRELCDRWVGSGRRIRYVAEAVVEHAHPLDLRGFCRQHFAYGRGSWRFHVAHARRTGRRIRLDPAFYLGLHRRALRERGAAPATALQLALLAWHVTNSAGYLWQLCSSRRRLRSLDRGAT